MKKNIIITALCLIISYPSFAGLDFLSIAQDVLTSFQEKMNLVIKQYVGIQTNLQEVTLNRDAVNKLRDQLKTELEMRAAEFYNATEGDALEFLRSKTSSVTLSGIPLADAAGVVAEAWPGLDLGAFVSPQLNKQVVEVYVKRKNIDNDAQASLYNDIRMNNLTNENIARLYANGLVHRLRIMEEEKQLEEITTSDKTKDNNPRFENTDVSLIIDQYARVNRQASHRWLEIKDFKAAYIKMLREAELSKIRIDDVADITGQEEDNKQKADMKTAFDVGTNTIGDELKNVTLTEQFKRGIESIKSGNYSWKSTIDNAAQKASEALTESGYEGYGSIVNNSNNAINSALQGDWSGVVNSSAGLYSDTHANEQEVSGAIRDTNNALNSALQGNLEGAYNAYGEKTLAEEQNTSQNKEEGGNQTGDEK